MIRQQNVNRFSELSGASPGLLMMNWWLGHWHDSLDIIMRDHPPHYPRLTRPDEQLPGLSCPPGGLVQIFPELMTESESDMDLMPINWLIILHVKNGETNGMMERT